jgi:hypothetical protein
MGAIGGGGAATAEPTTTAPSAKAVVASIVTTSLDFIPATMDVFFVIETIVGVLPEVFFG